MRDVLVVAHTPRFAADEVYSRLVDFEIYPRFAESILGVRVRPLDEATLVAVDWEVQFRDGVLRWSERDRLDPVSRTVRFEQTEGDIEEFTGYWKVEERGEGSEIIFSAAFDLGFPSLAEMLDPVAEDAMVENIRSILDGFFGGDLVYRESASGLSQRIGTEEAG